MRLRGLVTVLVVALALAVLASGGPSTYAWTPPAALNTNATGDSGGDYAPQVTTGWQGQLGSRLAV